MKKVNKNTKVDNTDKKMNISDVSDRKFNFGCRKYNQKEAISNIRREVKANDELLQRMLDLLFDYIDDF